MNCSRCGTYGSLTALSSRGPWLCASCSRAPPLLLTGVVVPLPRSARRLDFGQRVCQQCHRVIGDNEDASQGYAPTGDEPNWFCRRCVPRAQDDSDSIRRREDDDNEDQAAAMVRLLGPQRRRPREQQPPTEEDKKELESKQEEEEEPAPQRRRLRHLWLYFGTEPRGVRPARGFVDGDIIISMRESPSPMTEMNGTSIMLYRLPRQQLPVLYRFALHDDETRDNNNNSSGWYMDFELDESPDANAFIDSENVSILFRNNRIRFTNHAFTELFRLLMDMVQSQRRIRQVERDLGFTPSS